MSDRVLDLDKARAARAEAAGEAPVVVFAGREYVLPVEVPADFAFAMEGRNLHDAIRALFLTPEDADSFFASKPTLEDLGALADGIGEMYGLSAPESVASGGSSSTAGDSSRPTSSGSTGSTSESRQPAGAGAAGS